MSKPETKLRRWLAYNHGTWMLSWIEPNHGSTIGVPDAMMIRSDGKILLLELKVWGWSSTGQLKMDVRPAQKAWHRLAANRKAPTGFLVGLEPPPENIAGGPGFLVQGKRYRGGSGNPSGKPNDAPWTKFLGPPNMAWWRKNGMLIAAFPSADVPTSEDQTPPRMSTIYDADDLWRATMLW